MKFRSRKTAIAADEPTERMPDTLAPNTATATPGRGRWSTTFLMAGSALLGATAIAFWNRRTIASMRAQIQSGSQTARLTRPSDEEIF
jgi:hypothetical protein